ncbi:hypothetical protein CAEBREN_09144 [Caenorhabditis brenneri]|uniref:Uncharacterized protein n=1 Tax=Caenorhabditis brenneri TaxID=135651 RepID=G0N169_CAEBE|nr:hypothetical protein CAEBREN_09144 [Caenorhabditis brenneri]
MLNSSCLFEDPLYVISLHWLTSFISIPVYGIAFIVLFFKCPKYFNEYRNHVIVHIVSGPLQDFHLRVIWKLSIHLPWAALCSNGFLAEYAVHSFQIFIILLIFTGISIISMFIYRMEVATKNMENVYFQKIIIVLRYIFYAGVGVVLVFLVLVYPDLKRQKEYKVEMEQSRGEFPSYMWCDNCFFMQLDSRIFLYFYSLSYCCIMCAFTLAVLAATETLRALNSGNERLSARTRAIQMNFMFSLIVAFIALAFHFVASMTALNNEYLAPFLVLLIQDHGSVSTFTMIITNKLLRRATKRLFLLPENLLRRSEPRMFERKKKQNSGVHVLTAN